MVANASVLQFPLRANFAKVAIFAPSAFRKCYLSKKYIDNHIFTLYNIYHLVVTIDKALEYF